MMIFALSYLLTLALGTPILLLIMLLPAFLELKKPRDAGPRRIMLDFSHTLPSSKSLIDLEEHCEFDLPVRQSVNVILSKLPSIDV